MKKILSAALALSVVATMAGGCSKKEEQKSGGELPAKINIDANNVSNIDEMQDWTGNKLDLIYWWCNGACPTNGKKPQVTTVDDELTRVSGISWNTKDSFDCGGEDVDARVAKIIATKNYPDVVYEIDKNLIAKFAENDMLWDLTELIPKYMDNYMKLVNSSEDSRQQFESLKVDGKLYTFVNTSNGAAKYIEGYTEADYENLILPEDTRNWVWMRDDIVKMLNPEAKSQEEIKKLYMENGTFTEEDMTDITIKGYDGLRETLEKINALNLTENGRKVWPFYTHNGGDNWNLLTIFNGIQGAPNGMANYFAYWDVSQKKMVRTIDQPWFKEQLYFYNKLIIDGLASKECLIDNKTSFDQKKNNGEFAIIYGNDIPPTDEALKAAGKNYSYRKVLVDVPVDNEHFLRQNTIKRMYDGPRFAFFKTRNIKTEQDIEQVLRYIDFFYSEAGQKFSYWGPDKAGLYTTDENGFMKYTDTELENNEVYDIGSDAKIKYGFEAWPPVIDNFRLFSSKYNPKVVYKRAGVRTEDQYTNAWRYSAVDPNPDYPMIGVNYSIWNWSQYVDEIKRFWDARAATEEQIKLVFTAQNDSEFESYFNDVIKVMEDNGLTNETMDEWNEKFKEVNEVYMEDLLAWEADAQ